MTDAQAKMAAALSRFGWKCTDDFWQRYHVDPWVFNLANAVERLTDELNEAQLRSIEDRNPGIDMAQVKASRAGHNRTATVDGPDYCRECSDAAQDWVQWPCPGSAQTQSSEVSTPAWSKYGQ